MLDSSSKAHLPTSFDLLSLIMDMQKLFFIGKVFLLTLFICLIFFVVQYADTVRSLIASRFLSSKKAVAGAHTSFEEEIKKDMWGYADQVKGKVLDIKISDIVQGFSKTAKIAHDVNTSKEYIINQVNILLKK